MHEIVTRSILSIWTIARNFTFLFSRKCCSAFPIHQHWQLLSGADPHLGPHHLLNGLLFLVSIGTKGSVKIPMFVQTAACMASVVSVVGITEPKTIPSAKLAFKLAEEKELLMTRERVRAARGGPSSIDTSIPTQKRKADDILLPKFRRRFAWADLNSPNVSPAATLTETAPPLPSPPEHLLNDPTIHASLHRYSQHITVETPFNIDAFQSLLADHPNQPFVRSVITGLREGFWPLNDGDWKLELEEVVDNYPMDSEDLGALCDFRDREVGADRWSQEIPELLPGMKVSPMFVIWQNAKPRVVTDHSASGLNDGILREDSKVRYDMHDFGQCLHDARNTNLFRHLTLYKSDVASAFLNLPAHPIWQLRQVVIVNGKLHIVRRLVFGNRASPRIWCSVSGLLCWIAIHKFGIVGIYVYMDDFYGWDFDEDLIYFHGHFRPRRQVRLLQFWESISCPFDDKKQTHGPVIKIIGFWVDIQSGSISLSPNSISEILSRISDFLSSPGRNPILRDWQRLSGHLNWMLNVLPWGRPAMTELYRKMSGKSQSFRRLFINAEVKHDLLWLASIIPQSIGIRFVDTGAWHDSDADLVVWTDASLHLALSFVYNTFGFVYQLHPPDAHTKIDIFFLELVAIMSAVHHIGSFQSPPKRLLLFTDSLDSVGVFNSLHTSESIHNAPLLGVASVILRSGIDLRVRHIEGKNNIRADLLSRLLLDDFSSRFPSNRVRLFDPPRDLLPARWRECFLMHWASAVLVVPLAHQ